MNKRKQRRKDNKNHSIINQLMDRLSRYRGNRLLDDDGTNNGPEAALQSISARNGHQ